MKTSNKPPLSEIAVKRIGNYPHKPTVIFLHDSLGCIELWRDFPERLSNLIKCNVLIYDRQGYGKSCAFSKPERDNSYLEDEADILIDLIDYWHADRPILFGHSDGGSIALIAAGKYPDIFSGIITEGAHIFVEDVTMDGINEAIVLYNTTNLKGKLEKYHGDKTEAMFWAWASTWTTDEFKVWSIEHFLPKIECPSLIIQGEKDEYGTLAQVNGINKRTKGRSGKLVIPKVKHTPHKEVPEIILDSSAKFINHEIL